MSFPSSSQSPLHQSLQSILSSALREGDTDIPAGNQIVLPRGLDLSSLARAPVTSLPRRILPFPLLGNTLNPLVGCLPSALSFHAAASGNNLLRSVAAALKEKEVLDEARNVLLRQHILQTRERMIMEDACKSYLCQALVKASSVGGGVAASPSHTESCLPTTAKSLQSPLKEADAKKTLEILGSSLRQGADPYIDVSVFERPDGDTQVKQTRGGVTEPFPEKLHRMLSELEKEGKTNIASFLSHGRAFSIHDIETFVAEVMPRFFKQTKWNSFARQLSLYGFIRITTGPDAGGYYHELFLKVC
jgi:hypothetical protein